MVEEVAVIKRLLVATLHKFQFFQILFCFNFSQFEIIKSID